MDERDIFIQVIQVADLAERAALIDAACGDDPALRQRVVALLDAHDRAMDFLESPPTALAPSPTIDQPLLEKPGTQIGPYRLLQELGEGGMGTVFLAEQQHPVERRVALKIIKAGMDSRQVVARFEAEEQALAMMDHPHIAKVFDAGMTPAGRPYFVMELVKGIPITQYCDQEHLTPRERLELFIPVCQALQHAHQKGIIHRDVKPSNVIVALYDGKPVPKVIDFGVAKATGAKLTERTMFTEVGSIVGTLEYMAPEQAELNNLDIDTRADIYSLGVLLYELLAGSPPFTARELRSAAFDEMLRIIREVDPPKPSTKLSSSDELPAIAAKRKLEPQRLTKLVSGELDWIVMKCLEKERARRYETATGLAADIFRYLHDEPVAAGPPGAKYRLKKYARKHKQALSIAAAFALLLVLGTAISVWQAIRAVTAERIAKQNEQAAIENATKAEAATAEERRAKESEAAQRKIAEEQRRKAEEAEALTLADYRASTDEAIAQLIGSKPTLGRQERSYLEKTLQRWQAYADRQGTDQRNRRIRAEGMDRVADLRETLGLVDEALAGFREAIAIRQQLVDEFPTIPAYREELAHTQNSLGGALYRKNQLDQAAEQYRRALALKQELVDKFPTDPDYRVELATTHVHLGQLLAAQDQGDQAAAQYHQALDLHQALVDEFATVPQYRHALAKTHGSLGILLVRQNQGDQAAEQLRQAADLQRKLADEFPEVSTYREELAGTCNSLGVLLARQARGDEAVEQFRAALDPQQKLADEFPALPTYREDLSNTHLNLGAVLSLQHQVDQAAEQYRQALDIKKKLVHDFPEISNYQIDLGGTYCNYGHLISTGQGKPADSLTWFDQAMQTLRPIVEQDPRRVEFRQNLRNAYAGRAMACDRLEQYADAVTGWDRVIELSPAAEQPELRARRANSCIRAGRTEEAIQEVAELTKSDTWNAGQWYGFACIYSVASRQSADEQQAYADRAMELLQTAVAAGYQDTAHIAEDTDLDPLRERADFQQLLQSLPRGGLPGR